MGSTLRLVRHGETVWSAQGRFTGHRDVGLSAVGVAQARALAEIATTAYTSRWTSDLVRCTETARLMGVEAAATADLRELDFGLVEGKRWDDLGAGTQQGLLDFDGFTAPGGERVIDFTARIDAFVDGLGDGHHLLITHGGVIRHLLRRTGDDAAVAAGSWRDVPVARSGGPAPGWLR